jgi:hypothetical protein
LKRNRACVFDQRVHVGAGLFEHALDRLLGCEDGVGKIGILRGHSSVDVARSIQQCAWIRSSTCFAKRGLNLRRQYEQLSPSLHHDLTHVPSSAGHDLHRFALGGTANLIAKASKLISLSDPRIPAHAVLLDEIGDRSSGRRSRLRIVER